ncbi:hypothetical protein TNCV_4899011 [Trichonephila clavipes]|nr:hypothetical protein TNCV_4899011 [Trichonephila clavipes]
MLLNIHHLDALRYVKVTVAQNPQVAVEVKKVECCRVHRPCHLIAAQIYKLRDYSGKIAADIADGQYRALVQPKTHCSERPLHFKSTEALNLMVALVDKLGDLGSRFHPRHLTMSEYYVSIDNSIRVL